MYEPTGRSYSEVKELSKKPTAISQILKVLEKADRDLTVGEITKISGLSRNTVHYTVHALLELEKIQITRMIGKIPLYELAETNE